MKWLEEFRGYLADLPDTDSSATEMKNYLTDLNAALQDTVNHSPERDSELFREAVKELVEQIQDPNNKDLGSLFHAQSSMGKAASRITPQSPALTAIGKVQRELSESQGAVELETFKPDPFKKK